MKDADIVREVARVHEVKLCDLSEALGYSNSSGIANRLKVAHGMQSDVLSKILKALDAELIVRDKDGNEWKVDAKE